MNGKTGRTLIVMILFIIGFAVWAYAQSGPMPKADPADLWEYITEKSPYESWEFWPDHQGMQPGRVPHGPLHKVYVNDLAYNSSRPPLPSPLTNFNAIDKDIAQR